MAIKVDKTQAAHFDALLDAARDKMVEANQAIAEFNAAMEQQQIHVEGAVTAFNQAMANLRTEVEEWVGEWRGEFEGRSERWQEGDAGSAATDFIEAWEGWQPMEVDIAYPDPIDEIEEDEILEAHDLPKEPQA